MINLNSTNPIKEKKAVNYGINSLNMNELLETDYYQKDKLSVVSLKKVRSRVFSSKF